MVQLSGGWSGRAEVAMLESPKFASDIFWNADADLKRQARLTHFMRTLGIGGAPEAAYAQLVARADADPGWFWDACIGYFGLRFSRPYSKVCEPAFGMPWTVWCLDGETNLALNCLTRHRDTPVWRKHALVWEGEDGSRRSYTYAELDAEVGRVAAGLEALRIGPGEVVALYMPAIPEWAIGFFAVLAVGAVVLPVPADVDAARLGALLRDSGAVAMLMADGGSSGGVPRDFRATLAAALVAAPALKRVVTVRHLGYERTGRSMRDRWWHRVRKPARRDFLPRVVPADTPALVYYAPAATNSARLRGTVHTHCGFMTKMALDFGLCLDWRTEDRVLWMSDPGSLAGPMQLVAATLLGATLILAEGEPHAPDGARLWRLLQEHHVTVLGASPASLWAATRAGGYGIERYDLRALRLVVAAGEDWRPEAWHWTFEHVCRRRVPILGCSGAPDLGGGVLTDTLLHPLKPCAFSAAVPGSGVDLVDEACSSIRGAGRGTLVMRRSSIGMTRGLWNDPARYFESYWSRRPDLWWHGASAARDEDGYWFLTGPPSGA